jgi:hypothetical protein
MTYRVLVTGSRTWPDRNKVADVLRLILLSHPDMVVVHGACRKGPDRFAEDWCRDHSIPDEPHPADWSIGRGAGYVRNAEMVATRPDECIAFIKDKSKGASHCADAAEKAGIPTRRCPL